MPTAQLLSHPSMTEIRFKNLRFIVTNSPTDENIQGFLEVNRVNYRFDRLDLSNFSYDD